MKNFVLFFIFFTVIGCKKETIIEPTNCVQMNEHPNFKTEDLNPDYSIQFPLQYNGEGLLVEEAARFDKYSDSILVQYSFLCPTDCIHFYGGSLDQPIPNSVIGSTIDGTTLFDQIVEFCKNDIIQAIFYHNSDDVSFGTLYLKIGDQYLESAGIRFKKEKLEEVITILATLNKN